MVWKAFHTKLEICKYISLYKNVTKMLSLAHMYDVSLNPVGLVCFLFLLLWILLCDVKEFASFQSDKYGYENVCFGLALQGGVPASQHERGSVVYHQLCAHNHNRVCKSDCKHTNTTSHPDKLQSTKMEI